VVTIQFDDLSAAFDFVSAGPAGLHWAYASLDTGEIYWISDEGRCLGQVIGTSSNRNAI
jgi:hypothetical protein